MCRKKKRVKYLISSFPFNPHPIVVWRTIKNAEGYLRFQLVERGFTIQRVHEDT